MNKEDRVNIYIKRQLEVCDEIMNSKIKARGKVLKRRSLFSRILEYIKDFQEHDSDRHWVIIPGLRGTGKTTLLAQSYAYIKEQYPESHVIYFSVDDLVVNGFELLEILEAYLEEIGQKPERAKNIFIMLDEIQSSQNWASILKTFYDRAPGIFLLCSGSSAVNLQSNADIAGRRAEIECLYPMSFCEYESIEHDHAPTPGLKDQLEETIFNSLNAEECYARLQKCEHRIDQYCDQIAKKDWIRYIYSGSLPFTLPTKDVGGVYKQVLQTVEKVIYKDLPQIDNLDAKSIPVAMSLLQLLSEADSVSINKLSTLLKVSPITLTGILNSLCKAELLIRVVPYGSNFSAARKNNKYLFASSTIRAALYYRNGSPASENERMGRLLEDVAGLSFYRRNNINRAGDLFYDSSQSGADFIIRTGKDAIVFEIGKGKKDSSQVENTLERLGAIARYGITVCETSKIALSTSKKSVFIPWRVFAISG